MPYAALETEADLAAVGDELLPGTQDRPVSHFKLQRQPEELGEGLPAGETEWLLQPVAEVAEKSRCCAKHRKASVGVAKGQRNAPCYQRVCGQSLVTLPAHCVGGLAQVEDGVEQQLHGAAPRSGYQIHACHGLREAGLGGIANP